MADTGVFVPGRGVFVPGNPKSLGSPPSGPLLDNEDADEERKPAKHMLSSPAVAARVTAELLARRCFLNAMRRRVRFTLAGTGWGDLAGTGCPNLTEDTLRTVALHGSARSCIIMQRVCSAWRAAFADDIAWQALVHSSFPRAAAILFAFPGPPVSYKAFYQEQLMAQLSERSDKQMPVPTRKLADYLFTFELQQCCDENDGWETMQSFSCAGKAEAEVPLSWSAWQDYMYGDEVSPPVRLSCFVSCVHQGRLRTACLFKTLSDSDEAYTDDDYFYPPLLGGHTQLTFPIARVHLNDNNPDKIGVELFDDLDGGLDYAMSEGQLLRYLEFVVPW